MIERIVYAALIMIASSTVASLFTFFVTTISMKKTLNDLSHAARRHHEQVFHKPEADPFKVVKDHAKECEAPTAVKRIERGVLWLVSQQGGNPREIGLFDDS